MSSEKEGKSAPAQDDDERLDALMYRSARMRDRVPRYLERKNRDLARLRVERAQRRVNAAPITSSLHDDDDEDREDRVARTSSADARAINERCARLARRIRELRTIADQLRSEGRDEESPANVIGTEITAAALLERARRKQRRKAEAEADRKATEVRHDGQAKD